MSSLTGTGSRTIPADWPVYPWVQNSTESRIKTVIIQFHVSIHFNWANQAALLDDSAMRFWFLIIFHRFKTQFEAAHVVQLGRTDDHRMPRVIVYNPVT